MTKYDIGAARIAYGEANRRSIEDYFKANPFATQQECARDLGLGVMAVSRHFRALRAERLAKAAELAGANAETSP